MKIVWSFLILFVGFVSVSFGQVEEQTNEVTDEELQKFAMIEWKTLEFVEKKTEELKKLINKNEIIKGGARFNELKTAWGNSEKELAIAITDEEREAFKSIKFVQDSLQQSAVEFKADLIRDEQLLGINLYQKINSAIKINPVLQEKLDQMVLALKEKRTGKTKESTSAIPAKDLKKHR
jgi:hypothetical protein